MKCHILEWEPNYEPRQMHTPGLGIKDFVSDVGQIVKNRKGRNRKGRRRISRRKNNGSNSYNNNNAGLYHQPGTSASTMLSTYDDNNTNYDDVDEFSIQELGENRPYTEVELSQEHHHGGGRRQRILSDSTDCTGDKADDEDSDDDMELL